MSQKLSNEYGTKTILELRSLQDQGHLNLEPGFQRKSVWTMSDRRRFIQSVLEGYPVPSIFLYRREENGIPIYDVLDGKQRLETIFMFAKVKPFARWTFDVKFEFPEDGEWYWWDWKNLEKHERTGNFLTYKMQVAEVSGDLADIVDLFVRINSTGKPLTSSEKRHARFYTSPFLKESLRLAKRHRQFLMKQGVIRAAAVDRMKDVELVSELIASIVAGGPIHKKQAVDRAIGNTSIHAKTLEKATKEFSATLRAMKLMFPDLRSTRFSHQAEFYTLFLVIHEIQKQKLILTNRKRNQIGMEILREFSNGVDAVRERQRTAKGARPSERLFADYLMLVQQSTDALGPRTRRMEIVRGLLSGVFERKDERRIFSVEQRRLLWNSEEKKKCAQCGRTLDWTDFQVDHVKAYNLGGKTTLRNAAILCASCNASKGAKKRPRQNKTLSAYSDKRAKRVRKYLSTNDSMTPKECRKLLKIGASISAKREITRLLRRWSSNDGFLRREGRGGATRYYLK